MSVIFKFLRKHQFVHAIEEAKRKKSIYLNISSFESEVIPDILYECRNLERLYLEKNKIKHLDPKIADLVYLTSLALDYNELENLPPELGNLYSLESLNISHNPLKNIPIDVCSLLNLMDFWCNSLEIDSLPEAIGNLYQLDSFGARNNKISKIPESFCNLFSLRWLTLENNCISRLPESFGNLDSLVHLNLSKNLFVEFPYQILKCYQLHFVLLNENEISSFSLTEERREDLKEMTELVYVDLCNNPLTRNSPFRDHLVNFPKATGHLDSDEESLRDEIEDSASTEESGEFAETDESVSAESSGYDWENSCPSSLLDSQDDTDVDVEENEFIAKYIKDISRFVIGGN